MPKESYVRVECDGCGVVRVALSGVVLRACLDDDRWTCCFRCPWCRLASAYETSDRGAIGVLIALGTPVQRWRLPAELVEHRTSAPALTPDDLLDFHLLLQEADWLSNVLPANFSRPARSDRSG